VRFCDAAGAALPPPIVVAELPGLIPVPARAGDVLLHNTRLVHGSQRSRGGALRRTLYYEFQSMEGMVKQNGPRPGFAMTEAFIRENARTKVDAPARTTA